MAAKVRGGMAMAAVIAALAGVAASPAYAFSTGQFSRAEASEDWTQGSFAGSATWTDCNAKCKSYLILVLDEPSVYTCAAEDWLESDPNIRTVWQSGSETVNQTIPIEASGVSLLKGIYGQRLCMIGIQSTEIDALTTVVTQQLLANKLFDVEAPPPPEARPSPPSSPSPEASSPEPPKASPACKRARTKVKRLRHRLRKARRARHARQIRRLRRSLRHVNRQRRVKCD